MYLGLEPIAPRVTLKLSLVRHTLTHLGFGVAGLGCRIGCLWFMVKGSGLAVLGLGFRGSGFVM